MLEYLIAGGLGAAALAAAILFNGDRRYVAVAIIAGLLTMQMIIAWVPPDLRYLASCLTWVIIGKLAISKNLIVTGILLILSGLCYAVQEALQWPPFALNPALAAADIFGSAAILGVYFGGNTGLRHSNNMGGTSGRRLYFRRNSGDSVLEKEAP